MVYGNKLHWITKVPERASVAAAPLHRLRGIPPLCASGCRGPLFAENPVEMGMRSHEAELTARLAAQPLYVEKFAAAFPGEAEPITYDNFGKAVGAFERGLLTPGKWDTFLKGNKEALSAEEKKGFATFAKVGCVTCHNGAGVGGMMYQKLGLVKAWPDLKDNGRADVTKNEGEKFFFKVPSLRNITETAPYLHDGSVKTLDQMVKMMAEYQLGKQLTDEETASIITFLKALKGEIPTDYVKAPKLPEGTADTPKA